MSDHQDTDLTDPHGEAEMLRADVERWKTAAIQKDKLHAAAMRIVKESSCENQVLRDEMDAISTERDTLRAEVERLRAAQAAVELKPLVDGPDFVRDALGEAYFIEQRDGVWGYHKPGRGGFTFGGYGMPNNSREDMLAIIQHGCKLRVLSAVITRPERT